MRMLVFFLSLSHFFYSNSTQCIEIAMQCDKNHIRTQTLDCYLSIYYIYMIWHMTTQQKKSIVILYVSVCTSFYTHIDSNISNNFVWKQPKSNNKIDRKFSTHEQNHHTKKRFVEWKRSGALCIEIDSGNTVFACCLQIHAYSTFR